MLKVDPLKTIAAAALTALAPACATRTEPPPAPTPPATAAPAPPAASQPVAGSNNAATVERMPQVLACTPTPRALLMGRGPGNELFSVICSNGYGLLVQCISGTCRVMN